MDDTTSDLLTRASAGDPLARERLFARCRAPLNRFAHGRLPTNARDLIDTDDLVQMAMIRGLERMDGFVPRHEGSFLAYLRTILLNHMRDELRRQGRRPARVELDPELCDPAPSPLEDAIGREALDRYERALQRLQPDQREAIILRFEMGFSHEEIAARLERPTSNAARLLLKRAIPRLAEQMKELR